MRNRSPGPRSWRRGWVENGRGAARLALHQLSAANEHRGREDLGELFRRLARDVPEIERHPRAPAAFEKARDRRITGGPVAGQNFDACFLEGIADFASVDRRGLIDLARQTPVRREINEYWFALLQGAGDPRLIPCVCGCRARHRDALRDHDHAGRYQGKARDGTSPRTGLSPPLEAAGLECREQDTDAERRTDQEPTFTSLPAEQPQRREATRRHRDS